MIEKIMEEIGKLYVDRTGYGYECNLKEYSEVLCGNCCECIKSACKVIIRKHMNDGWISAEERMPVKHESVLMCDTAGCREVGWLTGRRWVTGFSHADTEKDIVAWQPLPEPYRPEKGRE